MKKLGSSLALQLASIVAVASMACSGGSATGEAAGVSAADLTVAPVVIYDDALGSGWSDLSWATHNLANTSPVASGTRSISVTYAPWSGLYFHTAGVSTSGLATLDFQVNGGANSAAAIDAYALTNGAVGAAVSIAAYCTGGSIETNAWTSCHVPLSALGAVGTTIDGIELQEGGGLALSPMYFDTIELSAATSAVAPTPTVSSDAGSTASATTSWIYQDSVVSPWLDESWASDDLSTTSPVAVGADAISVTMQPWQALYFAHPGFDTTGKTTLSMMVNGGATGGGSALQVRTLVNGTFTAGTPLGATCAGGAIPNDAWVQCNVPLSAIAPSGATITGVAIQEATGKTLPMLYFDEIGFDVSATAPVTTPTPPAGGTTGTGTGTVVAAGTVSTQTWTPAASPYLIEGDISIPSGQKLTIEPGVTVLFEGHYRMTVTGAIDARGTAAQPILFTPVDHVAGWYGVRVWNPVGPGGADSVPQYFEDCVFEYANKQGVNDAWYNDSRGALFIDTAVGANLHLNDNTFRYNTSLGKGAALMISDVSGAWTMTGDVFQDNHATDSGGAVDLKHSTATLTFSGGSFTGNSTAVTTTAPNSVNGAGGAIVVFSDSAWALQGVVFSGNTPDDWSGPAPTIVGVTSSVVP